MPKKLAAILVADICGYSALVARDEQGTVARVETIIEDIVRPAIAAAGGHFIKHTGDGFIAEFASATEAFRCACAVHAALADPQSAARQGAPIDMRIGMDIGDILFKGESDVFGNGVITAARLEPLAPRGGICLSERARDQLRDSGVKFEDIGPQRLKNLPEPVRAFLVHPGGVEAHRMERLRRAMKRRRRAIALAGLLVVAGLAALYWAMRPPTPAEFAARWIAERDCAFLRVAEWSEGNEGAQFRLSGAAANPELIAMEMTRDAAREGVAVERVSTSGVFPANTGQCQWLARIRSYQYAGIPRLEASEPETMAEDKGRFTVRFNPGDLREHVHIYSIDPSGDILRIQDRQQLWDFARPQPDGAMEARYIIDDTGWHGFLLMESDAGIPDEVVTDSSLTPEMMRRFDEAARRDNWTFELVWMYSGMESPDG